MPYTLEDLDNALANSLGPIAWHVQGPGNPGFCRPILMRDAAGQRWFRDLREDEDSAILREAWDDLSKHGYLKPTDGWDGEERI